MKGSQHWLPFIILLSLLFLTNLAENESDKVVKNIECDYKQWNERPMDLQY